MTPAGYAAAAAAAEAAGFDALFVTERCADAFPTLQVMAAATSRMQVGTAVSNLYLRHPVMAALTAAAIDEVADGRVVLGLGTANTDLNQRQLGLPDEPPLARTREYVRVVKRVLAGGPVHYDGEIFQVDGFTPDHPPARPNLPVYLGALQPRMLGLAGAVADGVMMNLANPSRAGQAAELVRRGAVDAGRDPAEVAITCVLPVCLSDDEQAAHRTARAVVVGYAGHPAAGRMFADSGYREEMAKISDRLAAGDPAGAMDEVTDAMAASFVVAGDAQACGEAIDDFRSAGIEMPILCPMPVDATWEKAVHDVIGALAPSPGSVTAVRAASSAS